MEGLFEELEIRSDSLENDYDVCIAQQQTENLRLSMKFLTELEDRVDYYADMQRRRLKKVSILLDQLHSLWKLLNVDSDSKRMLNNMLSSKHQSALSTLTFVSLDVLRRLT